MAPIAQAMPTGATITPSREYSLIEGEAPAPRAA
jgi:hypothetical protein